MDTVHIDTMDGFLQNVVVPGGVAGFAAEDEDDIGIEEFERFGPLDCFLQVDRQLPSLLQTGVHRTLLTFA